MSIILVFSPLFFLGGGGPLYTRGLFWPVVLDYGPWFFARFHQLVTAAPYMPVLDASC